jgi:hypothetical protein
MLPFPLRQTDWQLLRLCPRPLLLVRPGSPSMGPLLRHLIQCIPTTSLRRSILRWPREPPHLRQRSVYR